MTLMFHKNQQLTHTMNDYTSNYDRGSNAFTGVSFFTGVMTRVYAWMTVALLITAGAAVFVANSPAMLQLIYGNSATLLVLIIAELALVLGLSMGINKLSPTVAAAMFVIYSLVNGVTLSSIFFAYQIGTIYSAFAATALTFGGMSLVGYTTKKDLSGFGGLLFMGLIGIIIASLVNMFWHNGVMDSIITYIGVFMFVGLTAYDTQRIKQMSAAAEYSGDASAASKVAIMGALSLYLDFINLFLYLLRLLGRNRD